MEDIPVEQLYQDYQNLQTPKSVEALSHRLETWYKALCMSKLGGASYGETFEKACTDLSSSIGKISYTIQKPRQFIAIAHNILEKQIDSSQPTSFINYTNSMLKNKQPFELLESVWPNLSENEQKLLTYAYGNSESLEGLKKTGHFPDGMAFSILKARHVLKKHLQQQEQISFSFLDDLRDRDLAPLPLYEAKALKSKAENHAFEQWLADVPNICLDIIEFNPFAETMRSGALAKLAKTAPKNQKTSIRESLPETTGSLPLHTSHPDEENNIIKYVIIGFVFAVILFAIFVLVNSSPEDSPAKSSPPSEQSR